VSRTCVFCESGQPTREHALPAWISAELPGSGLFRFDQAGKQWLSKDAGKIVKAVCGDCNNGWMSDLEGQAKPVLAPAIRGEQLVFSVADQLIVGRWAAKTALMCEMARLAAPGDFTSRPQHRHLFRRQEPAPGTYVWLAAYGGQKMAWVEQHRLDLRSSSESDTGLATTMSIGHLVLQVVEVPEKIAILSKAFWQLPRLWPRVAANVPFPPCAPLSDQDVQALSSAVLSPPVASVKKT
jgi:hypothetical protein